MNILIILAGVYLVYKKTVSWQTMVSTLVGMHHGEYIYTNGVSGFTIL